MYRRPMSPYNTRVSTYLEALERDETINGLRRDYAKSRTVEAEFDDLQYEIIKAERQNKKLEEKNGEIQTEYLDKVKANKALISKLTSQIEDLSSKIRNTSSHSENKQNKNQHIIEDIKLTKSKIGESEQENKLLQKSIQSNEQTLAALTQTLESLLDRKKQVQNANKSQSESIDNQFNDYKQTQDRARNQQVINAELRQELALLKSKKNKFQLKVQAVQDKMRELKKKYQHQQFQSEQLKTRCHEVEKESSKVYAEALTLKQNIDHNLTKNKDHTAKLKTLEVILKQNINGLCVKHLTKQKMAVEFSDLTKDIQKAQAVIRSLNEQTEEQQNSNKGLIENLKKSIQNDEQAVKALTRKAAILSLISQS